MEWEILTWEYNASYSGLQNICKIKRIHHIYVEIGHSPIFAVLILLTSINTIPHLWHYNVIIRRTIWPSLLQGYDLHSNAMYFTFQIR